MPNPKYRFARFSIFFLKLFAALAVLTGLVVLIASLFGADMFTTTEQNPVPPLAFGFAFFLMITLYATLMFGFAQIGSAALDGAKNSFEILEALKRQTDAAEATATNDQGTSAQ